MGKEMIESSPARLRFTLGFKFIGVLILVLIPMMLASGLIMVNQVRQIVTEDINKKSKSYANFLAKVSRQGVKEPDLIILKRYIGEISLDKDVLYILVADTKNRPLAHSDKKTENLTGALEVTLPIFYKGERTGYIRIWYSFSRVADELTSGVQHILFLLIGLFVVMMGLIMFVISEQMIFNRIGIIIKGMKQVQRGDLSTRIEKLGNDELGYLALQFNQMVKRVEENQQELTLLFEVSRAMTAALDINLIIDMVVQLTVGDLQASSCCIFLVGDGMGFNIRGSRGLSDKFINSNGISLLEDLAQKSLMYNEPVVLDDFRHTNPGLQSLLKQENIAMVINIPLLIGDRKLGVLNINAKDSLTFPPERIELLTAFARQLAVALQNAQLYERTQQFSKELEEKINIATTDLARANERLRLANEKLQDLNKAKSDFIAIVSHELRSPLTSILGFTDLLLQGETGALDPTQKDFIDIINQNTKRLIDLINNLLNLSKIEAGRVELKKEPLDLEKTVHGVIHNFRTLIAEKKLVIRVAPSAEVLPPIIADENQLARVLTNLLANAVKYTAAGAEIIVKLSDKGDVVQVDVLDGGNGIESRDMTHMFERFYRAPKAKAENIVGTGLGLAIAKSIVEMHGGRIWAESPIGAADKEFFSWDKRGGSGAKFSFTLPK